MVVLKTRDQIRSMQRAGQILNRVLREIGAQVRPGITTADLDRTARRIISEAGAVPSFLNYGTPPFPGAICASVNDEVVHGIPSDHVVIPDGSIVSIDAGVYLDGWHSDAARTFIVGDVPDRVRQLVTDTETSFWKAAAVCRPGNRIGDVSSAVQRFAEERGYGVVSVLTGHGIGQNLHEEPDVPNVGRAGHGLRLAPGMVIAVEPMINLGTPKVVMDADGWTVRTADGAVSAHYENTIAVTEDGPLILTVPEEEAERIPPV